MYPGNKGNTVSEKYGTVDVLPVDRTILVTQKLKRNTF